MSRQTCESNPRPAKRRTSWKAHDRTTSKLQATYLCLAPPRRRLVAAAIHVTKAARGGALNSTILFPLALLGSRCPLARSDIGAILQAIIVHRVAIATASSFGCLCWLYLTPTSWAFVRKPNPGIMRHHEDLLKGKETDEALDGAADSISSEICRQFSQCQL